MVDLSIAQALVEGAAVRAKSANFLDGWHDSVLQLAAGVGVPGTESVCPDALFARPLGKERVAVVQVAGPPAFAALRFRFLILGKDLFHHLNDPFAIADRFPPDWATWSGLQPDGATLSGLQRDGDARGTLADLQWPPQPLPKRTVADLDAILKAGDGPFLLGAAQTLVDGGKIALERPAPEQKLLRELWALLPESTRRHLWPASFAFGNDLHFDVVVLPHLPAGGIPGYLGEDQVRDYPDSRYERHLQTAVESGDQRELDRLLTRRSSAETVRMALVMVLLAFGLMVILKALTILKLI